MILSGPRTGKFIGNHWPIVLYVAHKSRCKIGFVVLVWTYEIILRNNLYLKFFVLLSWNWFKTVSIEWKLEYRNLRGRFHQLSMYSFYAHGAQMREKDSQVVSLFSLFGSTSVKAERKYVGEIEPRSVATATFVFFCRNVQKYKLKRKINLIAFSICLC